MSSYSPTSDTEPANEDATIESRWISGKYVVMAMLGFGVCATSFLWLYTYFNNKPFIPLRHALVQRFQRSASPRVEGGQERGRGPWRLRIVLNVTFDPSAETPETIERRNTMEREVMALAMKNLDLSRYEKWEFILLQYIPESLPKRWESKREMTEVRNSLAEFPSETSS